MRIAKVAAAATALSLVGAATLVSATPANAATTGVGTSAASSSILDVALGTAGSVLNLRLLADDARSTIDPSVATPNAYSRLHVADITSSLLPAPLNNVAIPVIESVTPGGNGNVSSPGLDLGQPLSLLGGLQLPISLLSGVLAPASLTSAVDANGAVSSLTSSLTNLNLVGGLISATGFNSVLGTNAKTGEADGSRTIKAASLDLLDLGSLLNGLGLPLTDLPISAVSGIISGLGLPIPGLPAGGSLADFVGELTTTLNALVDQAQGVVGGLVQGALGSVTQGILGGLPLGGLGIPGVGDPLSLVNSVIDQVQGILSGILSTALSALDGASLLSVQGVEVGTVTKATDTVAGSVSNIVAKIGSIKVGGLSLPGLDLGSTLDTVNGIVGQIQSTLSGVLGSISPALANLVQVSALGKDPASGVTQSNGYVKSLAGVSALTAKIVPPLDLTSILGSLPLGGLPVIGDLLSSSGGSLPVLSTLMPSLNGLLGGAGNAVASLAGGATIKLASVTSGASFTTPVASTNGSLPRTGGTAQMALLGMALVIAAIASRRWVLAHRVNA